MRISRSFYIVTLLFCMTASSPALALPRAPSREQEPRKDGVFVRPKAPPKRAPSRRPLEVLSSDEPSQGFSPIESVASAGPSSPPRKKPCVKIIEPVLSKDTQRTTDTSPWARQNWLSLASHQIGLFYKRPEILCYCGEYKWTGFSLAPLFYDVLTDATTRLIEGEEAMGYWKNKAAKHAAELGLREENISAPICDRLETYFWKTINHTLPPEEKIQAKEHLWERMYGMSLEYMPRSPGAEIAFISFLSGRPPATTSPSEKSNT